MPATPRRHAAYALLLHGHVGTLHESASDAILHGKPVDGRWVNAKVPPALDMFQEMAWKRRQKEAQAAWEAASQ